MQANLKGIYFVIVWLQLSGEQFHMNSSYLLKCKYNASWKLRGFVRDFRSTIVKI